MKVISALLAGLVFGIGLIVSGMINPQKVLNFLDIFGQWDPSLAFVMGGAILLGIPGFRLAKGRTEPLFAEEFHLPTRSDITPGLIVGGVLFGIGWGLGGFCPGPAMTGLPTLDSKVLLFVAAMLAGMLIGKQLQNHNIPRHKPREPAAA